MINRIDNLALTGSKTFTLHSNSYLVVNFDDEKSTIISYSFWVVMFTMKIYRGVPIN